MPAEIEWNGRVATEDAWRRTPASDRTGRAQWERELWAFLDAWWSPADRVVFRTSGSTGAPRPLTFEKEELRASAHRTLDFFDVRQGQSALLCLPIRYVAGAMMVVRALVGGLRLVVAPPDTDFREAPAGTVDFAAMVPLQIEKLLDAGRTDRVRRLLIGGAALPAPIRARLRAAFGGRAWETYAMTETLTHVAVRDALGEADLPFEALPGVRFATDGDGRLVIHDPLRPVPVVTEDRVELLSPTTFRLLGRADFVINSGGVKVHPEAVERVLASRLPGPLCVSTRPDERLGERVVLVLERAVAKAERQAVFAALDRFERPVETLVWDRLPRTPTGKIDRAAVRRRLL